MNPQHIQYYDNIRRWLFSPFIDNQQIHPSTIHYEISEKTTPSPLYKGKTILIQQFYIDKNISRHDENKFCLRKNVENMHIDEIILLNEREYNVNELGIKSDKIQQIIIKDRLTYSAAYKWAQDNHIDGYAILANSDIFFDNTLNNVKMSNLHNEKKTFALLRYEYHNHYKTYLNKCQLFGPRPDSQDVWIWHTRWKLSDKQLKLMNFCLGIPGCDNKIIYILHTLGFICYNEPEWIRSYHYHTSQSRTYNASTTRVPRPYYRIFPIYNNAPQQHAYNKFNIVRENDNLRYYIENKIKHDEPFIIPRVASIEHTCAIFGNEIQKQSNNDVLNQQNLQSIVMVMKNNAGIQISTVNSLVEYATLYMEAFKLADTCFWWEPTSTVSGGHSPLHTEHRDFLINQCKYPKIDAEALDVFHHITREPWTRALRRKRILIVSPFADSMKEQIPIRQEIYGIDLFPECEFVFLKPPQTCGDISREFNVELNDFIDEINKIKDSFDIALCSCGGYGNLVCSAIYKMGKSAVYVGGVLQMYFGIYGKRWLNDKPDMLRLYLNKHWKRPSNSEKPTDFEKIKGGCYW